MENNNKYNSYKEYFSEHEKEALEAEKGSIGRYLNSVSLEELLKRNSYDALCLVIKGIYNSMTDSIKNDKSFQCNFRLITTATPGPLLMLDGIISYSLCGKKVEFNVKHIFR